MNKIGLLHYAYPPKIGGVELLLQEHAHLLTLMGYQVKVLTGSGEEKNEKIDCIIDPVFQSVLKTDPSLQKKIVEEGVIDEEFYKLGKTIEQKLDLYLSDRDIIIVHNMLTLVHNMPFIWAFKRYVKKNPDKKIIIWVHDQTYIDNGKVVMDKKDVNLNKELNDLLLTPIKDAYYITISDELKKLFLQIVKVDNNFIKVIKNGINIKRFLEIDEMIGMIWGLNNETNLLNNFPILLSPVNILERKNLIYCIEVISYLKEKYPRIKYFITGKPSEHRETRTYYEKLKKLVRENNLSDNVLFLSEYLNRSLVDSEMHDLYDLADIVLYLSKQENFGLPIIEGLLTKSPLFVSNIPVFHEIGEDNVYFIDTNELSAKQASRIIEKFIDSDKRIKGNYRARSSYSLYTILQKELVPIL